MHDYLISITCIDKETLGPEVKHVCEPQRHRDITAHCAKIRASKHAKNFGLVEKTNWTRHSQSSFTKTFDTPIGESRFVLVQRVSKLTR